MGSGAVGVEGATGRHGWSKRRRMVGRWGWGWRRQWQWWQRLRLRQRWRVRVAALATASARMAVRARRLRQRWRVRVAAPCRDAAKMDMSRGSVVRLTLEMLCIGLPVFSGAAFLSVTQHGWDPLTLAISPFTAIISIYLLIRNLLWGLSRDEKIEAIEKAHNDLRGEFDRHVAKYEKDRNEILAAIERIEKVATERMDRMDSAIEHIEKDVVENRDAIEHIEKDVVELKSTRGEKMAHHGDCHG